MSTYHVYNLTLTCSYNGVKCSWHILDMPLNYHTKTETCPLNLTIIYPYHVPKMSLYWYLLIQLGTSWYCLIPLYTSCYLLVPLCTSRYLSFYFHTFCWLIDWHLAITIRALAPKKPQRICICKSLCQWRRKMYSA